ncbi:helix-turn-helix domain-containing protein [Labrys sp. KNU-23]|nr:helix-turn-helix domain-containing protein [Labrys sp. KNU-23]
MSLPFAPVFAGLLTIDQAAAHLCIGKRLLREHVRRGEISYVLTGKGEKRKKIAFALSDLEAFITRHRRVEIVSCPSTSSKAARTTCTTSNVVAVDFMAIPKPPTRPKPGPSSSASARQPNSRSRPSTPRHPRSGAKPRSR